jgi:hypothetical protein
VTHHVIRILQTGEIRAIGPATSDHSDASDAVRQSLVNLAAPAADADAGHIAEDSLPTKPDPQPVEHSATGPPGIIAAVADKDVAAFSARHCGWHGKQQNILSIYGNIFVDMGKR